MRYVVCTIRDRCADVYAQPFFAPTLESAIRSFRQLVNDPQGGLPHTHPDDFDLYHLGVYDDLSGSFDCEAPHQVAIGKEMVKPLARA